MLKRSCVRGLRWIHYCCCVLFVPPNVPGSKIDDNDDIQRAVNLWRRDRMEIKRKFPSFSSRLFALEQLLTNCWVSPIVITTDDVFITMGSASLWQKRFDWRSMILFCKEIGIGTSWQWKRERIEWVARSEVKIDSHFEFIRSLWTWLILAPCAWSEWDLNQHE